MKLPVIILFCALLMCSCSGKTTTDTATQTPQDSAQTVDILGEWSIESIVINDTTAIRPAEMGKEFAATMIFSPDSLVGITTNCNSLGGQYILKNDSIRFDNLLRTEMACDNMDVEEYLVQVLPAIATVEATNDSTLRLNAPGALPYINLRRP